MTKPLRGIHVLSVALNIPGPVAAARLQQLGAMVTKIEPPAGDPLHAACPAWYRALTHGQKIMVLDLKSRDDGRRFHALLAACDVLLTAQRPQALARMKLDWPTVHRGHPRLIQIAILGYAGDAAGVPGHDLTYQAKLGLVSPPQLPRTVLVDLVGGERAVSEAMAALFARERGSAAGVYREIALADVGVAAAKPLAYGMTVPGGVLGGGLPGYNLYRAKSGWIALAALEPHFWQRLGLELGVENPGRGKLATLFRGRSAEEWETWAAARELPIVAVRDLPPIGE